MILQSLGSCFPGRSKCGADTDGAWGGAHCVLWAITPSLCLGVLSPAAGGGLVTKSCLTLATLWTVDCSLPGSSVHGILQARTLEWVAISFSKGSFRPRSRAWVSCIAGGQTLYQLSHEAESLVNPGIPSSSVLLK